jgi:hypothetical protein
LSKILLLLTSILVVGCASTMTETMLRNDKGETRYCYLSTDQTLAKIAAVGEYNKCLNDAGQAGFRQVQKN